jgi:UDP-glucuronate 4-epimerase
MHYLITGGAGFIGSHLVEKLLGEGAQVTVIDNFDPLYPRALKEANLAGVRRHPGLRFVEGDIRDLTVLRQLAASYDSIIHLAAKAGVRPSIAGPMAYQQVNVAGTGNLLEFARECGVSQFVFASSSSVYGVNPKTPWSEQDPVLRPISPYAATKVSAELLGHVYSHLYGTRFLALRFFTVYGPRQRPDLAIRKFSQMIQAHRPIPVFGDGSSKRDYTYVTDIVEGIRAALDYCGSTYEVINLGCGQPVKLLELIRAIELALGEKATLDFRPEQPGDVPCTYADISKATQILGYGPKTQLQQGLAQFADWLSRQPDHPGPPENGRSGINAGLAHPLSETASRCPSTMLGD